MAKDNKLLGNIELEDIEENPRGSIPINLTVDVSEEGLISVKYNIPESENASEGIYLCYASCHVFAMESYM